MSARSVEVAMESRRQRGRAIVAWVKDGPDGERIEHSDELMWGFWYQVGAEDYRPPDAIFRTEELAQAFAALTGVRFDFHVGPVVVSLITRDNFEVPR